MWVDMTIDENNLRLTDERGLTATVSLQNVVKDKAQKPMQPERVLGKLGATVYRLRNFENRLNPGTFIPASVLTELRRKGTDMLDRMNMESYPYDRRRPEDKEVIYPDKKMDARGNVANMMARKFYKDHGVEEMETAVEKNPGYGGAVMTTRYCMLRELGACQRDCKDSAIRRRFKQPLTITTGPHTFRLAFDCARCEMSLFKD